MLVKASGNFDPLHILERRIGVDLVDVLTNLTHAESIYLIAPGPSVGACRTAAECLSRRFEAHHDIYTARTTGISQGERWRELVDVCAGAQLWRARQAWIEFKRLYKGWSDVVHGNTVANQRVALDALREFHAQIALLVADYCSGATVAAYRTPFAIHDVLRSHDKIIQELRSASERTLANLDTHRADAEAWKVRAQRAEEAQRAENQRLKELTELLQQPAPSKTLELELEKVRARLASLATDLERSRDQQKRSEEAREEAVRQADLLRDRIEILERFERESRGRVETLQGALALAEDEVAKSRVREAVIQSQSEGLQRTLVETASNLEAARSEAEVLRCRQTAGDRSEVLREMLERSEAQVKALSARERELIAEQQGKVIELQAALDESKALAQDIGSLKSDLDQLRTEAEELTSELDRLDAYRRHYPDEPEQVSEFLRKLLLAQCQTPPFECVTDAVELPGDPYYDRFLASYQQHPCTIRIRTHRCERPLDDLIEGWSIEASNLKRIGTLKSRPGIAALLSVADPDRPGFSVFERPSTVLLDEFGFGGRRLSLLDAVAVVTSLLDELAARDAAGIVASWPDSLSVAVLQGTVVLLDPVATHFGDLGPPDYIERSARQVKYLDASEFSAGHAYAVAHAFVRLTGLLKAGTAPASIVRLRWMSDQLSELRRQSSEPIELARLQMLAERITAALNLDWRSRPSLRDIRTGLIGVRE
jgi:hypothetical protein